jgi:hypothetical protein
MHVLGGSWLCLASVLAPLSSEVALVASLPPLTFVLLQLIVAVLFFIIPAWVLVRMPPSVTNAQGVALGPSSIAYVAVRTAEAASLTGGRDQLRLLAVASACMEALPTAVSGGGGGSVAALMASGCLVIVGWGNDAWMGMMCAVLRGIVGLALSSAPHKLRSYDALAFTAIMALVIIFPLALILEWPVLVWRAKEIEVPSWFLVSGLASHCRDEAIYCSKVGDRWRICADVALWVVAVLISESISPGLLILDVFALFLAAAGRIYMPWHHHARIKNGVHPNHF